MSYTQKNRLLALSIPAGDDVFLLTEVNGTEGLSTPSEFYLDTLVDRSADIDSSTLIGQPVNFDMELDDGSYRVFNGLIKEVTLQGRVNDTFRRCRLQIVTQLDKLTLRSDQRIFQHKSHLDIVKEVLEFHKVTLQDITQKNYPELDYCTQYQETDLHFVHRLLKEAGICYKIKHETGKHTVVLFDSVGMYESCKELVIEYVEGSSGERRFYQGNKNIAQHAGHVSQGSVNFLKPLNPVRVRQTTGQPSTLTQPYDQYHYPALTNLQGDSEEETRRRGQLADNGNLGLTVKTTCRSLQPGEKFAFQKHPNDDEAGQSYVITQIHYRAKDDTYLNQKDAVQEMDCQLRCVPATVMYHTPDSLPRPSLHGVQTAVVAGPKGEEIFTDKYGRIKVQFHWDREGKRDENSSCWVRIGQPWADSGFGGQFIPRIGQEVLVHFEDGDINKPLVLGSFYNGANKTAFALPANKSQSGVKTRSSKGADPGEYNELRFDDKKNQETLHLQAQKNHNIMVKDTHSRSIGNDQTVSVGHDRHDIIKNSRQSIMAEGDDNLQAEKNISWYSHKGGIVMEAKDAIELRGGESVFTLKANGDVLIRAKQVDIDGDTALNINGGSSPSPKRLTPQKVKDIFTTPTTGGTAIPRITVTPVMPTPIAARLVNTSSREKLEEEALEYMVLNYDNLQKIMKSRPYCEELEHAIQQAQLAQHSYGRVPLSEELLDAGWVEADINRIELNDDSFINSESGFKSKLYYNKLSDEYTLAYAGTDMTGKSAEEIVETIKDAEASFTHGMFGNSKQYEQAMGLASAVKDYAGDTKLNITGHSLGGGLATGAALVLDQEATVFNSSALTKTFAGIYKRDFDKVEELVNNYVVDGEILNATQDKKILAELKVPIMPPLANPPKIVDVPIPNPMPAATSKRIKVPKPSDKEYSSAESHGIAVAIKGLKEMQIKNCVGI